MEDYIINVTEIEELQMIGNLPDLERIFEKAKINIIGGGTVVLIRRRSGGQEDRFDEITSLDDFETYRKWVFKHL